MAVSVGEVITSEQFEMGRLSKNVSVLALALLMAVAFSGGAQAWAPSSNLGQIETWLLSGNLNGFLYFPSALKPSDIDVLAAFYENTNGGTNFRIWILVKDGKNKTKICFVIGFKPKKYDTIQVSSVKCYKCKKFKKHHHHHHHRSSSSSSSSSHSHSHSSSSSSSNK